LQPVSISVPNRTIRIVTALIVFLTCALDGETALMWINWVVWRRKII